MFHGTVTQVVQSNQEVGYAKDTEIENRPTVTRGERGGNFRGVG